MLSVFASNDYPSLLNVILVIAGVVMVKGEGHDIYGKGQGAFKAAAAV